jgi:hypothetical protein
MKLVGFSLELWKIWNFTNVFILSLKSKIDVKESVKNITTNLNEVRIACEKIDLAWEKNIMKDIYFLIIIK